MLLLGDRGPVFLEVPKTASTAVRRMLLPHAAPLPEGGRRWDRHIGARAFRRRWHDAFAGGGPVLPETVCVVRDPVERAASWYRYRQRDKVAGLAVSSRGMSFADFLAAALSDDPPAFAVIGCQARFTGYAGGTALVDHIFDYRRLDLLVAFLEARLGTRLALRPRNATAEAPVERLPEALVARYRAQRADEWELCGRVAAEGVLRREV